MLYSTEISEGYNFVIQLCSIHFPKQAPSVDIACSFLHIQLVRHLISSGSVLVPGSKTGAHRQAGCEVLELANDTQLQEFLLMKGVIPGLKQIGENLKRYMMTQ